MLGGIRTAHFLYSKTLKFGKMFRRLDILPPATSPFSLLAMIGLGTEKCSTAEPEGASPGCLRFSRKVFSEISNVKGGRN